MKTLMAIFAAAFALTIVGPVFAADASTAKTEAACQKAGGNWDPESNSCIPKQN